ncbi:MAG: SPFH domain-containing protein [Candidatus Kariarchaeaceae archaeon]
MSSHFALLLGFSTFIIFLLVVLVVTLRYKRFSSDYFVVFFRSGRIKSKGYGGGYFPLPFIDELVAISATILEAPFSIQHQVVFKPKFANEKIEGKIEFVKIRGTVMYRIIDPEQFLSQAGPQKLRGNQGFTLETWTSSVLTDVTEGELRRMIAEEAIDRIYSDRELLKSGVGTVIGPYIDRLSLELVGIEISNVELVFADL